MIKNRDELIDNGLKEEDKTARKIVLDVLEKILMEADPRLAMKSSVKLRDSALLVEGVQFDLNDFENIFIVGGGKAAFGMAQSLEEILGPRITRGFLNIPYGSKGKGGSFKIIFNESSHPLPDEAGLHGSKDIVRIAEKAGEKDLVIVLISGGASSLLPYPAGNLSLGDIQSVTDSLLKSGAVIDEINVVRKHLSRIKGGWLAMVAYPATTLSLIISDVVGDRLDVIASGPTFADPSTYEDSVSVLRKYGLLDKFPRIKNHLERGVKGFFPETLKEGDPILDRVHNFLISTNERVIKKVVEEVSKDYVASIYSTSLRGEARDVGRNLGALTMEVRREKGQAHRPRVLVGGGETTVSVKGGGLGGRNQELVLSAMERLRGGGIAFASMGSDGVDGPTDAAGALADGWGHGRAKRLGLSIRAHLDNNDSHNIFRKLDDLIITGPTGTNVNDVVVMVVVS
jgi:glycerate-2-kinase